MRPYFRSSLLTMCFLLGMTLAACGSAATEAPSEAAAATATEAAPTSAAAPTAEESAATEVPAGETVEVIISGFAFNPENLTISVGDSVTWINQDYGTDHTVTADDGSVDSGVMPENEQFTFKFDTPGTYAYYCQFHGGTGGTGMSGVITVEE